MAIERSLPCIPTIKKVREKGGGGYSRGALADIMVLGVGGYSVEGA